MLKFIHLTDTHLVTPGQALYGTDPKWRLQRALAAINERHGDSRFMVVTGDLAHWGSPRPTPRCPSVWGSFECRCIC